MVVPPGIVCVNDSLPAVQPTFVPAGNSRFSVTSGFHKLNYCLFDNASGTIFFPLEYLPSMLER